MDTYSEPSQGMVDPQAADWERTWSVFTHLTIFILPVFWIPVIPALIMWLIRRHESPFADDHGKEAVNFQITIVVYGVIAGVLSFICIGWPLAVAIAIFGYVCAIIAAVAAGKGRFYRYPMCLRFIS